MRPPEQLRNLAPRSSNDRSLTTWSAAACGELGCAGARNAHKRYVIHVAGHNLDILMRLLIGAGTPKEAAARGQAFLLVAYGDHALAIFILTLDEAGRGILAVIVIAEPT